MGTALRKPSRVTEQEYLDFETASPLRHELAGGVIYGMVGGSRSSCFSRMSAYSRASASKSRSAPSTAIFPSDVTSEQQN